MASLLLSTQQMFAGSFDGAYVYRCLRHVVWVRGRRTLDLFFPRSYNPLYPIYYWLWVSEKTTYKLHKPQISDSIQQY